MYVTIAQQAILNKEKVANREAAIFFRFGGMELSW